MRLDFELLAPLWLLIPAALVVFLTYKQFAKKHTRQRLFVVLRMVAVGLIILSMCSISIVKSAKDTATLFICDLSDSTLDRRVAVENFVAEAIKSKGADDIIGVIGFGADSATENQPSKNIIFSGFQSYINGNFTNIQNALIHGAALFPANAKKRIVLITDGYENAGDSERQLRALVQNDTAIDVVALTKSEFEEVQLDEVNVPEEAGINQVIDIEAHIESNVKTTATILLYAGNDLKYEQQVELDEGTNKFIFTDTVSAGGILTYRVEIIPEKDTYMENNYLSSFCTVKDKPFVLLIQDEEGQGEQFVKMFADSMYLETKLPEEAPQTFEGLLKYDAFILADVSYERFNETFIKNLESVIKNQGKGLLVTGGDSSYGPGGYYQTLLEEILPVNIDVKPKEEKPNLGLVLVIDKSGSMTSGQYGITKLELAKEAAIRSTEVLEAKDQLGVIAFDDTAKWVVEMQKAEDKVALQEMIATIRPGGGTSILPSLKEAVKVLKDADTKLKHIILLTDGQAETSGYEGVLSDLQDNSITLSTVAVGEGADRALLEMLAGSGGGRYYATDEFSDIPSIFTKEAFMAGKKYLNNITFSPALKSWSQIMKGIEAVPELDGYVATSIKDSAKLLLTGPEDDPVLATWQYGLGRTAAWTSDANGIWTSKWLAWEESPLFWTNIVSWVVQQDLDKKYTAETDFTAGQGVITVKSIDKEASFASAISGVLVTPEGEEKEILLEATSPGTYTGVFDAEGEGVYLANLLLEAGDTTEHIITGLNVGYSPEYDFYSSTGIAPERIAEVSGGRLLSAAKEVFKGEVPPVEGSNNISNFLLVLGLILFLVEIIIRKTHLNLSFIDNLVLKTTEGVKVLESNVREFIASKPIVENNEEPKTRQTREKPIASSATTKKNEVKKKDDKQQANTAHLDTLLNKKRKRDS